MSGTLEFTILGCGSSGGVPRADGERVLTASEAGE